MPDELVMHSPRPCSLINLVQGTKGRVSGWPEMAVSLEIPASPHPASLAPTTPPNKIMGVLIIES